MTRTLIAAAMLGGLAIAAPASAHSGSPSVVCDDNNDLVFTYSSKNNWSPKGGVAHFSITAPVDVRDRAPFNSGGDAVVRVPAPSGFSGTVRGIVVARDLGDGFTDYDTIEEEVECPISTTNPPEPPVEVTPPVTPSPSTPPPPSAPSSSPPVAPMPTSPLPPPVIPVGPDTPPKRTVTKRTRIVRGCLGPWSKRPRTAIRVKRAFNGKWYSFRDVRRITYITIRTDDKVKRGRRIVIVNRGGFCGPINVGVTG